MLQRVLINLEEWALERMDTLIAWRGRSVAIAPHLQLGHRGERQALFECRRRGYTVVARRWRSPKLRGDLDLIAWDGEWLCFIEVKTRSVRRAMTPAEIAVDREKQRMLRRMADAYLRRFPEETRKAIPIRFDVVAIYGGDREREFEFFRGAFD